MNILIEGSPLPGFDGILLSMGFEASSFIWHLADVEAECWPTTLNSGWVAGANLMANFVPNETQFIWGVLDAFVLGSEIEVDNLPFADGNDSRWNGSSISPQIDGASFEIIFWDSSAVFLIGISDDRGMHVLKAFANARILR